MRQFNVTLTSQLEKWNLLKTDLKLENSDRLAKLLLDGYERLHVGESKLIVRHRCLLQLLSQISLCHCGLQRTILTDNCANIEEPHIVFCCSNNHIQQWYASNPELNENLGMFTSLSELAEVETLEENLTDGVDDVQLSAETGEFVKNDESSMAADIVTASEEPQFNLRVVKQEFDEEITSPSILLESDRTESEQKPAKSARWLQFEKHEFDASIEVNMPGAESNQDVASDVTKGATDDLRTLNIILGESELTLEVNSETKEISIGHIVSGSGGPSGEEIAKTLQHVQLAPDIEEAIKVFVDKFDIPESQITEVSPAKHYEERKRKCPASCEKCGCRIASMAHWRCHLNKHARLDHLELTGERDKRGRRIVRCPTCKMEVKQGLEYENHIAQNHPELHNRRYQCSLCNKLCISKIQMKSHLRIHHDNPIPCEDCGKVFSGRTQLTRHIRTIHKATYSKECEICKKLFKTNVHLKTHIQTMHLKEKQLECPFPGCTTTCAQKKSLAQHLKIHSSVLQLSCSYCSIGFKSPCERDRHVKIEHPLQYGEFKDQEEEERNVPGFRLQTQEEIHEARTEAFKKVAEKNRHLIEQRLAQNAPIIIQMKDGDTQFVNATDRKVTNDDLLFIDIGNDDGASLMALDANEQEKGLKESPSDVISEGFPQEVWDEAGRVLATFNNAKERDQFLKTFGKTQDDVDVTAT